MFRVLVVWDPQRLWTVLLIRERPHRVETLMREGWSENELPK